jgi:hypothetical protein
VQHKQRVGAVCSDTYAEAGVCEGGSQHLAGRVVVFNDEDARVYEMHRQRAPRRRKATLRCGVKAVRPTAGLDQVDENGNVTRRNNNR